MATCQEKNEHVIGIQCNSENNQKYAISEIYRDLDASFFAFGFDNIHNPSLISAHNFGTFLSKYGEECTYLGRGSYKLAEKKLKEAIEISPNYASYKELGDLYFLHRKYKKAIQKYEKALDHKKVLETFVNMATCYFYEKKYDIVIAILSRVLEQFEVSDGLIDDINMQLAYGYILLGNTIDAIKVFTKITQRSECPPRPDTLWLAYLCMEYRYIIDNYRSVMSEWVFDITTFQTIYQAYLHEEKKELSDFVNYYRSQVNSFYEENPYFDYGEKSILISTINDGPYIPNIEYLPQFVWQIDFLD